MVNLRSYYIMNTTFQPLVDLILELQAYIKTKNIRPDSVFMFCHKDIKLSFDSSVTIRSIINGKIALETVSLDIRDYIKIAEFLGKELKITII